MEYIKEFFKVAWDAFLIAGAIFGVMFIVLLPVALSDMGHFWWGGALLGFYVFALLAAYSYLNVKERNK